MTEATELAKQMAGEPMWQAYHRFVAALGAGSLPKGVTGGVAMDYDAGQIVIYVDRDDEPLRRAIRELVGDSAWRMTLGAETLDSDRDDDDRHFLGAYYNSEGIGDDIGALGELSDELCDLVERAGVGEIDGLCDEGDEQAIFMYGADADALLAVVEPLLRRFPVRPARIELRYGAADDPDVREREIVL